jgi:hypothetical protein
MAGAFPRAVASFCRLARASNRAVEPSNRAVGASDRVAEPFYRAVERFYRAVEPFYRAAEPFYRAENRPKNPRKPLNSPKNPHFEAQTAQKAALPRPFRRQGSGFDAKEGRRWAAFLDPCAATGKGRSRGALARTSSRLHRQTTH